MIFQYKAKTSQGNETTGSLESTDRTTALALLKKQNLFVIDMKEKEESRFSLNKTFAKKVPLKDKIIFTKQLAIMIRSGLSILEALQSLKEESSNKNLHEIILHLISEVEGGTPLSEALAKDKEIFGDIYINMVKSGEKSGKVDAVLERLAGQLEKDYDLIRKVKGALYYPVFVLVTMVIVVSLVIVLVIPQLKLIFDDAGISLPFLTRLMIGASFFLKNYGIYIIIASALLALALARWHKTKRGRYIFDRISLSIPVFGSLLVKAYMARFTRTFAALTTSGLPLLDVLGSSGKVIGNVLYETEIAKISKRVGEGELLSVSFKKSKLFPGMLGQLAAVGEKSGTVDEVFDGMADFFDREVDTITGNLSTLLEPILMVVIGGGIGLIVVSVLQPIYGLVDAI